MNRTLTINISRIIFHIDEDAYNKLSNYLAAIKNYFKDSDGRDEIMSDIESRIAEMLQEKITPAKQVVLMSDVDHVISVMGKPEQFAPENESFSAHAEEKRSAPGSEKTVREESFGETKKRVYRDPDDKILGGVCSGIGAYFNIDPIWLRIAFPIIFFVWGTGLLVYILLWIIIPKAVTSAQKLEMRGEPVNIDNIKKTVEEEAAYLRSKLKNFENEIKDFNSKKAESGFRTFIDKAGGLLSSLFTGAAKAIGKIIGFILVAGGILFLLVAVLVFSAAPIMVTMLFWGLILLCGIPLILLVYSGFKLLLGVKTSNRFFNFSLLFLWIAGLCISIFYGYRFAQGFSVKEETSIAIAMQQPKNNILYISSQRSDVFENKKWRYNWGANNEMSFISENFFIIDKGEKTLMGYPGLDIRPSENDSFSIELIKSARGRTSKEASVRSEKINYEFSQTDSLLYLNSYFDMDKKEEWKHQQVALIIKVPKNKIVFLDPSLEKIIHDIDNVTKTYDHDMLGHKWIMTENGLTLYSGEIVSANTSFEDSIEVGMKGFEKAMEKYGEKMEEYGKKMEEYGKAVSKNPMAIPPLPPMMPPVPQVNKHK